MRAKNPRAAPLPLSPAALYFLMLGREHTHWLPGWVAWAQDRRSPAEARRDLWPVAAAYCLAAAAPFDFVPWGASGRRPRGPGVQAWERAFYAEHGRRDDPGPRPPDFAA